MVLQNSTKCQFWWPGLISGVFTAALKLHLSTSPVPVMQGTHSGTKKTCREMGKYFFSAEWILLSLIMALSRCHAKIITPSWWEASSVHVSYLCAPTYIPVISSSMPEWHILGG